MKPGIELRPQPVHVRVGVPDIEVGHPGEAAHGLVTAAIANAVFDCLGVRVRNLPITRDSLIAAMQQS